MATGDSADISARLRALVPSNWFPLGALPVLDTVLAGPAAALSGIYGLMSFARAQMRLATSTGGFLDIWSYDFFGPALLRRSGELDASYSARISANLLSPANTRAAVIGRVTQLTGRAPVVFEPERQGDTGGWNLGMMGWTTGPGLIGSGAYPYQFFITAYRPKGTGIANTQGWGTPGNTPIGLGGWGARLLQWVSPDAGAGIVRDADIYATIAAVIPAGIVAWTQILDNPPGDIPANALVDGLGNVLIDGLSNVVVAA